MNQNQTNYLKSAFLPLFLAGLCLFALFFFFWESLPAAATDQNIPAPETTFHFREEVVSLMDLDSQTVQVVTVSGAVYQINQETGLKQIKPSGTNARNSVQTAVPLSGTAYLFGTNDGSVIYRSPEGERSIHIFKDPMAPAPEAAAGSVTHLFTAADKRRFFAVNYDGKVLGWSLDSANLPQKPSGFLLNSGIASGGLAGDNLMWFVGFDGTFGFINTSNPNEKKEFRNENFGTIAGGDLSQSGLFLLFGEHLESETPVVEVFDNGGKPLAKKTYREAAKNKREIPLNDTALTESFSDAKWLDNNHFAAALGQSVYLFATHEDTVKRLSPGKIRPPVRITRLAVAGDRLYYAATDGSVDHLNWKLDFQK